MAKPYLHRIAAAKDAYADHQLLAAAAKQCPEAFAVSLCAAMRMLCSGVCGRSSTAAASSASSTESAASLLSLLPLEVKAGLPPKALLTLVDRITTSAMAVLQSTKLAMAAQASATPGRSSSSSSSWNAQGTGLADLQHVPFVVSLLLTAQKCAAALRAACPKDALDVAATVGRYRIECSPATARMQVTSRAARSMWLIGQLLGELLPAASSSGGSSGGSSSSTAAAAGQTNKDDMDEEYFISLFEMVYACVEWLGWQLCHMQLPGDEAAATPTTTTSSSSPVELATSMPLLTQLLQQHAQLQTALYAAVQRCAAGHSVAQQHDGSSAAAASVVQRVWGDALPGQLRAFGAAVAAALPIGWACNNAACTNLGKLSELQLVYGRGKLCGGCRQVRVCSAEWRSSTGRRGTSWSARNWRRQRQQQEKA
uniref:MYND-type domain-containing protein n=1 Tax=Tetradesmus obliquus TaxID=3088 RepID=A0A383VRN8_TETOB|eukprot:jgi/Sobl393_1/2540/SZX67573.1